MRTGDLAARAHSDSGAPDTYLFAALFAVSAGAFCLAQIIGPRLGLASDLIAILGSATCGWSWLAARALFQPRLMQRTGWPLAMVLLLMLAGVVTRVAEEGSAEVSRVMDNLVGLISSSMLLFAAIEPLRGLTPNLPAQERRFRVGFAVVYSAMVTVAVIWVNGAHPDNWVGRWTQTIKASCAVAAVCGMGFAVWYRGRHPIAENGLSRKRRPSDADVVLGDRILKMMAEEAVFTRHNLKVSDLARLLGEAEYKVTQSITGPLAFRNFNHMANCLRIEEAKRRGAVSLTLTRLYLPTKPGQAGRPG